MKHFLYTITYELMLILFNDDNGDDDDSTNIEEVNLSNVESNVVGDYVDEDED